MTCTRFRENIERGGMGDKEVTYMRDKPAVFLSCALFFPFSGVLHSRGPQDPLVRTTIWERTTDACDWRRYTIVHQRRAMDLPFRNFKPWSEYTFFATRISPKNLSMHVLSFRHLEAPKEVFFLL